MNIHIINNKIRLIVLVSVFVLSHLSGSQLVYYSLDLPVTSQSTSNKQDKFGIRFETGTENNTKSTAHNSYNYQESMSLEDKPPSYFKEAYYNRAIEDDILGHYELYFYKDFIDRAHTLPHYAEYILDFENKLETDKKFREGVAKSLGDQRWRGFHKFIKEEAGRIRKIMEEQDRKRTAELQKLREAQPRLSVSNNKILEAFKQVQVAETDELDENLTKRYKCRTDQDFAYTFKALNSPALL